MSLPITVRPLKLGERSFVLSSWKNQLHDDRGHTRWGRYLSDGDFWALANHVIDKITLPSCEVFVATAVTEPDVALCWMAIREIAGTGRFEVLYSYAKHSIRKDPELAAALERDLRAEIIAQRGVLLVDDTFSPFSELKR